MKINHSLAPLILSALFTFSCHNRTIENNIVRIDSEQEWLQELDGEWAVQNDWRDSTLTFSNTKNKNFKQEIFPAYNTITFNHKNNTIEVKTYGEFGCGVGAIQNLTISNSKWNLKKGVLNLKFDYSDYSGQHHLENAYSIERTENQLILKKVDSIYLDTNKEISTAETDLLATLPVRDFPITDSTNFDNFKTSGMPDKGFLKRINFKTIHTDAKKFKLNYKIPYAENFTSIVVGYQSGDHELFALLITLNKESEIIDMLEIAYDEIAESAFRKTSKIEKDKIVVTSWNWMGEEPVAETETYILQNDGRFRLL